MKGKGKFFFKFEAGENLNFARLELQLSVDKFYLLLNKKLFHACIELKNRGVHYIHLFRLKVIMPSTIKVKVIEARDLPVMDRKSKVRKKKPVLPPFFLFVNKDV